MSGEIYLLAALLFAVTLAGWSFRYPGRAFWIIAYCALLLSGLSMLEADRFPLLVMAGVAFGPLFTVLLLAHAFQAARLEVPKWLVPAGAAVGLARAGLVFAGAELTCALLSLAVEPVAALAAAWLYHRHVVRVRLSPLQRGVAPMLVAVAGLEAWDAARDLSMGADQTLWIPWVFLGAALAALLGAAMIDEMRREGVGYEKALRATERRFFRLAERSRDLIIEIGSDGRITYASPNLTALLGFEPEEWLGRHVMGLRGTSREPSPLGAFQGREPTLAEVDGAGPYPHLWETRARDGERVWFEVDAYPYESSPGESRSIIVSRDVSERLRVEEERRAIESRMEQSQKLESLGILAGGIAHDFNNLLVGVMGNAEMLHDLLPEDSSKRRLAEDILRASERASDLTQQLLSYAGKAETSIEALELGELVTEMVELLRPALLHNVELQIALEAESTWIDADSTQVRQVVMNLITNAADALEDEPGVVSVRVCTLELDETRLRASFGAEDPSPGEYACVEVADTGVGIPPDRLGRIFDPFYTTKFQGRGLGLAAALGIVRSHRGALEVESSSSGTFFRVFLPRAATGERSARAPTSDPDWKGQGDVLVVDDEAIVRTAVVRILEGLGFGVVAAASGAEALDLFRKGPQQFCCALLDVTMPEMGGEELFWALRELRADIPVLFMSGHSAQELESHLLQKTRVARLRKPFLRVDLERALRALVEA